MHPISKPRMESLIAVIRLKELSNGFRVLSVEAALIESATEDQKKHIRDTILTNQTYLPEMVCCVALFHVEAIDVSRSCTFPIGYGFVTYSNLVAVQEKAATENVRRAELIKILSKEI
jgi:hypothetical protein